MKETLAQIIEFQDLRQRAQQIRRDIDRLSIDIDNQARIVEQLKKKAQQAHERRLELTKKADSLQLQVEEAEAQIAQYKKQLNVTKHQKEYDAIQKAILSRVADIGKWEDEALTALQSADDLGTQEKEATEAVEDAEQRLEQIRSEVAQHTAEFEQELAQVEAEMERAREGINPEVFSAYTRLLASNFERPLVPVKSRVCQGCFTQITKQTENLLMRGSEIVYCHSCGRMLLLADGEE